MSADVILSSAGVSVGALDFIKEVVAIRRQAGFLAGQYAPWQTACVWRVSQPAIHWLAGEPGVGLCGLRSICKAGPGALLCWRRLHSTAPKVRVTLAEAIESDGRESYLRAVIEDQHGELSAKLTGHQGSGNLLSLVQANALLIIPAGVKSLAIGAQVDAWLL